MIKEEMKSVKIYALDAYLVDSNTGKKVEDEDEVKNIEFGTMQELNDKISQYESSWNTDRKDGTVWKFTKRYVKNENRNESLEEDVKDLPTEVEIEYASLDADVLEYYDFDEAIKQYLQKTYSGIVEDFRYYWYDVNTILVHDIKWSVKESLDDDTVEETDEYKIVKTIQHNFRTVKGVARKGKDKIIYQVYFRTQDFNPATNRWQKTGWTNSTSEFDTIEDAREFVKKYDKTLKSEVEESVDNSEIKVYNNTEVKSMNEENKLEESSLVEEESDFIKKFGQYTNKPLSSEEFHKLMKDMRDFYEQ